MEILQTVKKKITFLINHRGKFAILLFVICIGFSIIFLNKWNFKMAFFFALIFWIILFLMDYEKKRNSTLVGLGFQAIDLGTTQRDNFEFNKILESIFKENNGTVAKEITNVYANFTRDSEAELTEYVLSFAFPSNITANKSTFRRRLLMEMKARAVEDIRNRLSISVDEDFLRSQVNDAFCFEVWFTNISRGKCYWMSKPFIGGERVKATHGIALTPEAKSKGVALVSQNYLQEKSIFEIDANKTRLAFNRQIPVVVGPADLDTGVIDIYSNKVSGNFTISQFARSYQKSLGLRVVEYNRPFAMKDRWAVGMGGYIEVKGHYNAGQFFDIDKEYQTPLSKNLRNIFQNTEVPIFREEIVTGVKKVQNLLQDFVSEKPAILKGTLAGIGNFEIMYKETGDGNRRQYHLQQIQWETKYFPKDDYESDGYKDPNNYRHFDFDEEGFAPLPFTEGYLMTGPNDRTWLCLFISSGSPAASSGDRISKTADVQLTTYLESFARINGITGLQYIPDATQGLVARGTQGNVNVYLKLLNPDEANFYSSGEIVTKLMEEDILPAIIQVKRINRKGQEEPSGILIFHTEELVSLSQLLSVGEMEFDSKITYCRKLATFSQQLIDSGIVCMDFTLKDTVEFDSRGEKIVFVCDYGSYIKSEIFMINNIVCKPEYHSPEDLYEKIDLLPQPYQVFKLGILFYQILVNSAYKFPELNYDKYEENYNKCLTQDIATLKKKLPKEQKKMADLIREMLSWNPIDRPRLNEVIEKMNAF